MSKLDVSLFKTFTEGKNTFFFLIFTTLGLAFSIAVVLSNFGLMEGYQKLFREGLKMSSSALELSSRQGFFYADEALTSALDKHSKEISNISYVIQSDGFIVRDEKAKGVLIRGIDPKTFPAIGNKKLTIKAGEIVLGDDLAKEYGLKVGDETTIAFARGNDSYQELPQLRNFKIAKIVDHGLYQKDTRLVYLVQADLRSATLSEEKINLVMIDLVDSSFENIQHFSRKMIEELPFGFSLKPYWADYKSLMEAVDIEKYSISLVLQIIVIISLFNVISFVVFISEKKSQEFFLLRSLGISMNSLSKFWFKIILLMWVVSCVTGLLLTYFFNWLLSVVPIFKIPGSVYNLDHLEIYLQTSDILIVVGASFFWLYLVVSIGLGSLKKKSILTGLREEFR